MVRVVTCLVFAYSEIYIEHYDNKKFFFLTILFFSFIRFLSVRRRVLCCMIGWDGLGMSSLFLIIFYPNKITLFNSFLTFFFNRVGDLFFLIFFCFFLSSFRNFFFFSNINYFILGLIFFFCLLTKRAQFPFSSWLPAAMSAPTPISAIVHSSTLVTAGILLFLKFNYFFSYLRLIPLLLLLRVRTFLLGGLIGVAEIDLKKIVAFSTIRQIRIILFFLPLILSISLFHTFGHALFKTLLFCGCGILFTWAYRDQSLKNLNSKSYDLSVVLLFVIRIFSIRGVIFSSSFFTKDLSLEFFLESKNFIFFFFLIVGRIFTIIYRSKIFFSLIHASNHLVQHKFKFSQFLFIFFFLVLNLFLLNFFISYRFEGIFCFVRPKEIFLLNFLIFIIFFLKKRILVRGYLSAEIFFIKNFFFRALRTPLSGQFSYIFSNDIFMYKPSNLNFSWIKFSLNSSKFWSYILIFSTLVTFFYYSFSLILNMVLKQPKFKDNFWI